MGPNADALTSEYCSAVEAVGVQPLLLIESEHTLS
jgi:hypothetical protein